MFNPLCINANSLEYLHTLEGNSIDLIIADPPYNLGKDYGTTDDNLNFEEYLLFSKEWLKQAKRILKPKGTLYVFMGVRFISYIYAILERELGLHFNSWICWNYTQGIGKTKGFSPRHDDILMFTKSTSFTYNLDAVRVPQKYYRARNNMRGANPGDVWAFSHVHYCNENRFDHPTQKPEGLMERMILASSNEGEIILDPFMGSGTAINVAHHLKRHAIGIDINPDYVEMTRIRLQKPFTGFDSMDERMSRVPFDLNDVFIRKTYLRNHIEWFLNNHPDALKEFRVTVEKKYGKQAYQEVFESRASPRLLQEQTLML